MSYDNKKILLIILILCIFIIIPFSSANELHNDTLSDSTIVDDNSIYVSIEGNDTTGDGSSKNPYRSISKASESFDSNINSNIYVKNGTYEFENQITIDKDLIIVGESCEGVIFDGKNSSALFKLDSYNTVQFNSLSFINGLGESGYYGYAGAIDAGYTKYLIIDNCIFKNNAYSALTCDAGSFESDSAKIDVKNSKFINNFNEGWSAWGGAVSVEGIYISLNITNCLFANNYATNGGGAVYINSVRKESFIDRCEFINNTGSEGSAICFSSAFDATITNSKFIENNASADSGVIDYTGNYYQRTLTIAGNNFENNYPDTDYEVDDNIEIVNGQSNDKLSGDDIDYMDIGDDVSFTVTLTDRDGNPISDKLITFTLTDYFKRVTLYNATTDNNGKAGISLINQTAGTYSVVSSFSGDGNWDSVTCLNTVKIKSPYSYNIVFNESIVKVNAGDSHLVSGYVCNEYISYVVYSFSTYSIQWKTHGGGTRYSTNHQINNGQFSVDVLDFDLSTQQEYYYINFSSTNENGAVAYGTLIIDTSIPLPPVDENIEIIHVDCNKGSDEIGDGSELHPLATIQTALYLNELFGGNKTIIVSEGVYNISNYEIYADVNIIGEKGKTFFKQHTGDNGMLYLDNGAVTRFANITFIDGDAGTYSLYNAVIVVRYAGAVAYFDGCEFKNNKASSDGMLYVANQASAYINNCVFSNNIARTFNPAGAVHVQGAYLSVNNSYFYNNTATEGGAIFVGGDSYVVIQNTMFYQNNALNDTSALSGGGAIYVNNYNTHIYNCSFVENYAELNGGAIYILTGQVEIEKSVFINNHVKASGSGIGTAIASDSGYTVKLYVKDSILYDGSYSNLIHISPDGDQMNEVILNDNYWGSNSKSSSSYTRYVIIKTSLSKKEICEGDLVEITVEFTGNDKELERSIHDYALSINSTLGQCDADSIVIVDNIARFNYIASKSGNETITFINGLTRYELKFNVNESSAKENANINISVNDDRSLITIRLPSDLTNNITVVVDNVKYCVYSDNGIAEIPINLLPGIHTAYATYEGDDKYKGEISDRITFEVQKLNSNLIISIDNVVVGEDIIAEISANINLNASVVVTVNNKKYTVKVTNGAGSVQIDDLQEGTYTATAVLDETEYFISADAGCEFNVTKSDIDVIYVSQARGNDTSGNGSYESAYATISKALERNNRLGGNKTIIIEEGNYILNRFAVVKDVRIISNGSVVISPGTSTNHLYIGGSIKVELIGLTFINGNGVSAGVIDMGSDNAGNFGKELIIANCSFINNKGAAGVISTYADTKISSSVFINNTGSGKTGFNQGIISVQANTIDLSYNIFLNNHYNSNIIVSRVNGVANDNFWGDNNKPADVSGNIELTTWAVAVLSIGDDIRTKTDYDLYAEFKQTGDGVNFRELSGYLSNLKFDLEANNGLINPQTVEISKNIGTVNYNVNKKGFEEIRLNLYGNNIYKLNFFADVPEYDKIYVDSSASAAGNGSSNNPVSSISQALEINKANGGEKTIIIKQGTYFEHNLIIDANAVIIGENAVINGENNNIFTVSANLSISNVTFINSEIAINHTSGELNIDGGNFTNNKKAVISDNRLNIQNSSFNGNTFCVIDANDEVIIKNSLFDSNNAEKIIISSKKIIISDSNFTNGGAVNIAGGEASIQNNKFNLNTIALIATGNVEITGNDFNSDSIILTSANAELSKNKNTTISIENSNITNSILTFINGDVVFADNGTVQLNATIGDDMGNPVNGGKIIFKSNDNTIGEADVKKGVATLLYDFNKGNYTISGSFSSDNNVKVISGLLRIDVDYYWFINTAGYETLEDAIAAAEIGDVIKGVPGTYKVSKLPIGHRYFSLEPWEIIKSLTITSLTDEPVTLEGSEVQMFFVDIGSELTLNNIILYGAGNNCEDGGAVGIMYDTNLTVINCTFISNIAENGGAIYSMGGNVIIRDSIFDNNFALVGGAVDIIGYRSETVSIENCTFTNNFAFYGGALYSGSGHIDIDNSLFYNNVANVGGALLMRGGLITVENTEFVSNTAESQQENYTSQGGAVHNYLGDLYFKNVKFIDNSADKGGALELENGLYGDISWTTFDNCTFINNSADKGGAIYMGDHFDPSVNITDSIFSSNTAGDGSVISALYSYVTVKNTEFSYNKGIYLFEVAGEFISGEGFSADQTFYGDLTVINSNFTSNSVEHDIFANEYGIIKVSDSKFDGEKSVLLNNGEATFNSNIAINILNNVIENNGKLSLNKNDFNTPVLNKKDITTPTFVVVLDNETKYVATGENYVLTAIVCDDNGNIIEPGKLQFVVNSEIIDSEYENEMFKANFTPTNGTYNVSAVYNDTGLLDLTVKTGKITVKKSSALDAVTNNITVGEDAIITVSVNPKATGKVEVKIDNKIYNSTVKNGIASFKVSDLASGEYAVEISYLGDEEYAPGYKVIKLKVSKETSFDFSFDINRIDSENADIIINLPSDAKGEVSVIVNGKMYNATVSDGNALINVDNMIIGENQISITYSGDDKYDSIIQKTTFDGVKKSSFTQIRVKDIKFGQDAIVEITVPDDATGQIIVTVNEKDQLAAIHDGKVILILSDLLIGNYEITADYIGNAMYLASNSSASFKVSGEIRNTFISLSLVSSKITGILRYVDGEVIQNAVIYYSIGDKEFNTTTDSEGKFIVSVTDGKEIIFTFKGSDTAAQSISAITVQASNKLPTTKIVKKKVVINAKAKKFKSSKKVKKYTVTLKSNKKAVKKVKVTLKIKGKKFTAKTNAKGKATFKIKKLTKKGKYKATVKFSGNKSHKAASKKVKITIK